MILILPQVPPVTQGVGESIVWYSSRVPCHHNRLALPSPYRLYIEILPIPVAWLPGLAPSWILALVVKLYLQVHVVLQHHRLEVHTGINLRSHSRSPQQTGILPSHLTWSFDSLSYSNPWQLASLHQNAHCKLNAKCWAQGAQGKCDAHASCNASTLWSGTAHLHAFFSHHSRHYILGSNTLRCGRSLQKPCYSLTPGLCSCCQLEILSYLLFSS